MSKPTPYAALYSWHTNAMLGVLGDDHPTTEDAHCGWFKRKLVKGGPDVPAKLWMYQPTDESGDLIADEQMFAEVDGKYADPEDQWPWLCSNPISEAEFNHLTALRQWSEQHAPEEPYANPRQPVDWMKVPNPTFTKEPTP
jgi:hypothetical protein